jgi:hypothetical protein
LRPAFSASGGQGALFEKTAPWTVKHLQKLFIKVVSLVKGYNFASVDIRGDFS